MVSPSGPAGVSGVHAARARCGQGCQETGQFRLYRLPVLAVHGDVAHQCIAIDENAPHGLQLRQHGGPVLLGLFDEAAQEEEITHAAHCLGGPVRFVESGAQPGKGDAVPGRDQGSFLTRLLFQEHLHKSLRVIQFDGQQHVAQDRQQVVGLGDGSLAAQE
jgi:hypothetical protein